MVHAILEFSRSPGIMKYWNNAKIKKEKPSNLVGFPNAPVLQYSLAQT